MQQILESPAVHLAALPTQYSSIMEKEVLAVEDYKRQLALITADVSSISDFIAIKLLSVQCEIRFLENYRLALRTLQSNGKLSDAEFRVEWNRVQEVEREKRFEALAIKLERRVLAEDMAEELKKSGAMDEAYTNAVVDRVNAASGRMTALSFDRYKFRRNAHTYYDTKGTGSEAGQAWCHVLGKWLFANVVRAAHIVPKSMDQRSLDHIFGAKTRPAIDVKNCLMLESNIEKALDTGNIVIVPADEDHDEWQCIVTNASIKDRIGGVGFRWKDLHKRKLKFRNGNRPAKRYLYFRYLITYLQHKWKGNLEWVVDVETKDLVWASPKPYLRRSTLQVLARQAFGEELVGDLFDGTFSSDEESEDTNLTNARTEGFAHSLMTAAIELGEARDDGYESDKTYYFDDDDDDDDGNKKEPE